KLESETWEILPTVVDAPMGTLSTTIEQSERLALAPYDEDFNYLKGLMTPSVTGLQTSLWTGDSTFSYPLLLPPGPAQATPALGLTYSSGAANSMLEMHKNERWSQASDFGLGWELSGAGAITRDSDGNHFLEFAGGGFKLERISGTNEWKTAPESFLQITHQENTHLIRQERVSGFCASGTDKGYVYIQAQFTQPWVVRTPDGTAYTLGDTVLDANQIPQDAGKTAYNWMFQQTGPCACGLAGRTEKCGHVNLRPYRWNLSVVQPTAGPAWTYDYGHEQLFLRNSTPTDNELCEFIHDDASVVSEKGHIRDTWLEAIGYDNDHYQVKINYDTPSGHRSDYPNGPNGGFHWDYADPNHENGYTCENQWVVSDKIADAIVVKARADTNQSWNDSSHVIRRYNLEHTYHNHLALTTIQEQDRAGAQLQAVGFAHTTNIGNAANGEAIHTVTNTYGGQVNLTYSRLSCGSAYLTCSGSAPQNGRIVVQQRDVKPWPTETASVQSYAYTGGRYAQPDPPNGRWEFWGFAQTTENMTGADTAPRRTETHFVNQYAAPTDVQIKGKIDWQRTVASDTNTELQRTVYTWTGAGNFPQMEDMEEYLDNRPHRQQQYFYQLFRQGGRQYGNVTEFQEISGDSTGWAGAPTRTTYNLYYPRNEAGAYVVGKLARRDLFDGIWCQEGCGTIAGQTLFYYDGNSVNTTPPTQGLLTRQAVNSGTSLGWLNTDISYWPGTANVNVVTDPNGHSHAAFYDSAFRAFPVCGKNASGHTTITRYFGVPGSIEPGCPTGNGSDPDPNQPEQGWFFGEVEDTRDPNDALTSYAYDTWGRLVKVWRPGQVKPTDSATQIIDYVNYAHVNAPFDVQVRQRDDDGSAAATYFWSWTFYDGLGQMRQKRLEADNLQNAVTDYAYNGLGLLVKESTLPSFSTTNGSYTAPIFSPGKQMSYDALGRLRQVVNPDGSDTRTYYRHDGVQRMTAVVDARDHQTIRVSDAFGRLVQVKEFDSGAYTGDPDWYATPYATTNYGYNVRDQLMDVWD
ncbi:MAG: hypothetical protein WAW03_01305, partial [Anaerolineae bacterium]